MIGKHGDSGEQTPGTTRQTPIPGPFPTPIPAFPHRVEEGETWRKGGNRDTNQLHGEEAGGNLPSAEQWSPTLPESGGMRDEG
jgi:hypothetical protein